MRSLAVAGELTQRADALSDRMLQVTQAIYQTNGLAVPILIGSGLLIVLSDARFLVTAGHVLDRREEHPLSVGVSPRITALAGDVTRLHSRGSTQSEDDPLDIGIVRLTGSEWDGTDDSNFATWDELDTKPVVLARHSFGLLGYPVTKNKKPPKDDKLEAYAYRMAGLESVQAVYTETKHDPVISLLVGFDRTTMWGPEGIRSSPDLYGVSGGGLWRFGPGLRDTTSPPRLSAVAIEWHPKGKHRFILGTRIGVVIGELAKKYSDIDSFVRRRM